MHAAVRTAGADALAPHHRTVAVRVEREDLARLLPGEQQVALRALEQDHRRAEIEVGPVLLRTARATAETGGVPGVVGEGLEHPAPCAGLEVERDDRVA